MDDNEFYDQALLAAMQGLLASGCGAATVAPWASRAAETVLEERRRWQAAAQERREVTYRCQRCGGVNDVGGSFVCDSCRQDQHRV